MKMATISVDFSQKIAKMKPMHGVGQPPFSGIDFSMCRYLTEAGIPFSRLHDVGGPSGGNLWVDIPNLFRDFNADPADPASYDFAFTDILMKALNEAGVEPFYRLGVTIENYASVKPHRIYPPADNLKWAKICEGIIRHYTEGWADGFRYDIRYWEIWNEPDNCGCDIQRNQMWHGTMEQYFELYGVASKYLKDKFPHLKIGGYASCGFYALKSAPAAEAAAVGGDFGYYVEYFEKFLDYVKAHDCPLDFFSWHSYDDVENTRAYARYAREKLDAAGYTDTETSCNEWNPEVMVSRYTARHAALITSMMLMFQNEPVDTAMFYDAGFGLSNYRSLFHPMTQEPVPAYYAFPAFNALYRRGDQVAVSGEEENVYAAAAWGGDGCVVVTSIHPEKAVPLTLDLGGHAVTGCRIICDGRTWEECPLPAELPPNSVLVVYTA